MLWWPLWNKPRKTLTPSPVWFVFLLPPFSFPPLLDHPEQHISIGWKWRVRFVWLGWFYCQEGQPPLSTHGFKGRKERKERKHKGERRSRSKSRRRSGKKSGVKQITEKLKIKKEGLVWVTLLVLVIFWIRVFLKVRRVSRVGNSGENGRLCQGGWWGVGSENKLTSNKQQQ